MTPEVKEELLRAWARLPDSVKSPPAQEVELRAFEAQYGPIPSDFRWFLLTCGGGSVGPEHVDEITSLWSSHAKFRKESQPDGGWTMRGVFVIGWDGGGNPYGIRRSDGRLVCEDHDFGGIHEMAPSFETFLRVGLEE